MQFSAPSRKPKDQEGRGVGTVLRPPPPPVGRPAAAD